MDQTGDLPPSVVTIAVFLGGARGYGNHLKWNEQAMFKADLMNVPRRWRSVDPQMFATRCLGEGMRPEDVAKLVVWLERAKAGSRPVPQRTYRAHRFTGPTEEELARSEPASTRLETSIEW